MTAGDSRHPPSCILVPVFTSSPSPLPICVRRPRRFTLAPMTVYETTNHQTIYHWATARGLWPACVAGSPDRIRLGGDEFAPEQEELEPIEWWRWFQEFDRRLLQLVYDPSKG